MDISDILNQAISDLVKSAKAGLFLAFTLVKTYTSSDQMS